MTITKRFLKLICTFLLFQISFFCYLNATVHAETASGSNSTDVPYSTANTWKYSLISISGAPSYATVDSIEITYNVDSDRIADIQWYVENLGKWQSTTTYMSANGDDWLDGFNETSEKTLSLTPSAGTPVNGSWYFNIKDTVDNSYNEGRIDSWSIKIFWTDKPKVGDIYSADPDTFSAGQTRTVSVRVYNLGRDDQNLIVDPGAIPSGWSISPSNVQFKVPYNTYADFNFSVTVLIPKLI